MGGEDARGRQGSPDREQAREEEQARAWEEEQARAWAGRIVREWREQKDAHPERGGLTWRVWCAAPYVGRFRDLLTAEVLALSRRA